MSNNATTTRPVRKQLDHSASFRGRFGATFFITICCRWRGVNQLCKENIACMLFDTARQRFGSKATALIRARRGAIEVNLPYLRRCAAESAGKRRGDVGRCDHLFGRFFRRHLLTRWGTYARWRVQ